MASPGLGRLVARRPERPLAGKPRPQAGFGRISRTAPGILGHAGYMATGEVSPGKQALAGMAGAVIGQRLAGLPGAMAGAGAVPLHLCADRRGAGRVPARSAAPRQPDGGRGRGSVRPHVRGPRPAYGQFGAESAADRDRCGGDSEDRVTTQGHRDRAALAAGLIAADDARIDTEPLVMAALADIEVPRPLLDLLVGHWPLQSPHGRRCRAVHRGGARG